MSQLPPIAIIPEEPTLRSFEAILKGLDNKAKKNDRVSDKFTYEEVSAFVDSLIESGIISVEDRMRQLYLCDFWDAGEFYAWREDLRTLDNKSKSELIDSFKLALKGTNDAWDPSETTKIRVQMDKDEQKEKMQRIISSLKEKNRQEALSWGIGMGDTLMYPSDKRDLIGPAIKQKQALLNSLKDLETLKIEKDKTLETELAFFKKASTNASPRIHCFDDSTEIVGANGIAYTFHKDDPLSVKVTRVGFLIKDGVMTLKQLEAFATPHLNAEVVDMYKQTRPKDDNAHNKTDDDLVEEVDSLIRNHKFEANELDKYVALGLISKKALAVWRVRDQERNSYFYGEDFTEPFEMVEISELDDNIAVYDSEHEAWEALREEGFIRPPTFVETLKEEATEAGVRILSTQAVLATKSLISKSIPEDRAEEFSRFLATEMGTALISMMAGMALTYGMKDNDKAQRIAEELRVQSMATVGNELVEGLMEAVMSTVSSTIKDLPENAIEEVEEEMPTEEEMTKSL